MVADGITGIVEEVIKYFDLIYGTSWRPPGGIDYVAIACEVSISVSRVGDLVQRESGICTPVSRKSEMFHMKRVDFIV